VKAGTVVVYGAAGGVGSALADTARHAGAEVIGTAGSDEKCEFIVTRGASHAINYNTQNVVERVNALTMHGADIVFDHVAGKAFTDGLKMIAPLGMIVSYAVLGGTRRTICSRRCAATSRQAQRCAASPCIPAGAAPRGDASRGRTAGGRRQAGDRGNVSARGSGAGARPRRVAQGNWKDRAEALMGARSCPKTGFHFSGIAP